MGKWAGVEAEQGWRQGGGCPWDECARAAQVNPLVPPQLQGCGATALQVLLLPDDGQLRPNNPACIFINKPPAVP